MNKYTKRQKNGEAKKVTTELEGMIRLNSRAFGYVSVEGREEDIEIPPELLNTALHRDMVRLVLHPKKRNGRTRGEVIEVTERAKTHFVGTLEEENGFLFVRPDDHRIYIDFIVERDDPAYAKATAGKEEKAPLGKKVAVELTRWSTPKKNPLVRITDVLGTSGEHETEMRSIVAEQGFDWHYPAEAEKQAEKIDQNKDAFFATEIPRRRDFRDIVTFTIDPDDAKDFDDAISIRTLENGNIELGVHIADVSAYVTPEGGIDKEAQKRATSIYLVDRTIPMLPEILSNNLCSLVPHEDRLAMSAVFEMSLDGQVFNRWFGETVINSSHRFSYQDAQKVLSDGTGEYVDELKIADTIALALRKKRFANGSIGFETDEIKFELDKTGKPVRAYRKERIETMKMIEDLMLLANREVATWVSKQCEKKKGKCVFVWRIHDTPKVDRIEELSLFLKALGHELPHKDGIVTAKSINALFKQIEGTPEQDMIETAMIRSMAKAIYSVKNIGHFGLAFSNYTHFTSPIRRYPDLMVHRIIKAHNAGKTLSSNDYMWHEKMCATSTEREISASQAERDSIKLKQVEYLSTRIGDIFDGIITGINDWGLFVEETESMAEGLVRTRSLKDDFYEMGAHGFKLIGTKTGRTLALGDKVRVKLMGVNVEQKQIDWSLLQNIKE